MVSTKNTREDDNSEDNCDDAVEESPGLRKLRLYIKRKKEQGIPQMLLAESWGVHRSYITKILNGERQPGWKLKTKLYEIGIDLEDWIDYDHITDVMHMNSHERREYLSRRVSIKKSTDK